MESDFVGALFSLWQPVLWIVSNRVPFWWFVCRFPKLFRLFAVRLQAPRQAPARQAPARQAPVRQAPVPAQRGRVHLLQLRVPAVWPLRPLPTQPLLPAQKLKQLAWPAPKPPALLQHLRLPVPVCGGFSECLRFWSLEGFSWRIYDVGIGRVYRLDLRHLIITWSNRTVILCRNKSSEYYVYIYIDYWYSLMLILSFFFETCHSKSDVQRPLLRLSCTGADPWGISIDWLISSSQTSWWMCWVRCFHTM